MRNHSGLIGGIILVVALLGIGYSILSKALSPTVTEEEFAQQLQQPGLMLVKFGAPWCSPCRQIDSQLSQLAISEYGNVRVVMINIDREPNLARKYGVDSIPHLALFRDGRQIDSRQGYQSRAELTHWVQAPSEIIYVPASVSNQISPSSSME